MTIIEHRQTQPGQLTIPILLVVTDSDYYPLPEDSEPAELQESLAQLEALTRELAA